MFKKQFIVYLILPYDYLQNAIVFLYFYTLSKIPTLIHIKEQLLVYKHYKFPNIHHLP